MVTTALEFTVNRCYGFSTDEIAGLQRLYDQLSDSGRQLRTPNEISFDFNSNPDNQQLFVARLRGDRRHIIGMVTLIIYPTISCHVARIEDLVVDQDHRSQGVAKELMERAVKVAKNRHVQRLDLTSRPERQAAHGLYEGLGMEVVPTNVYRQTFQ